MKYDGRDCKGVVAGMINTDNTRDYADKGLYGPARPRKTPASRREKRGGTVREQGYVNNTLYRHKYRRLTPLMS